ncbi:MAG TPA: undecaprenyl/decaprenyl-phosphate alpha-N-acetylglucosaminyl 1-phosphate transferase [Kineosporiaceae bacterium]|nr:undecaprenyl/decaprenyl-phosphate alpha-N-acetylglucosaminyl 1-phosphate transferase [Kineosporiaceae bacterium]
MKAYVFVLLVAALVTYLTTGAARRLARRIGAITPVRERDVHTVPIPRLGGVAMYLGIGFALLTASQIPFFDPIFKNQAVYIVLLSAGAVCLLGVFDDLWQLDAVTKLAGQALASGLMAWQGIQLVSLPIFGTFIPSQGVLIVLTVVAIVVTINAVNFVDGLDGLAAGIVAIAGSAFFVYSYLLTKSSQDQYSSLASLIAAALVGACVGFLPHNFNPARIFMGDSGSMLIGLLLATCTMAITGQVQPSVLAESKIAPAFLPLLLPLAVLALPLIDLGLAVIRRTRAGKMPWQPDKMHLHHRMLGLGHSHARAVLILYFWTATVGFGVAMFALVPPKPALLFAGLAMVAALLLTIGPWRGRRATGVPQRAEPQNAEPQSAEPQNAEPQSAEPQSADSAPQSSSTPSESSVLSGLSTPVKPRVPASGMAEVPNSAETRPRGLGLTEIQDETEMNSRMRRP